MIDQKIVKTGKITINENGYVEVEGFEVDGASCREVSAHAMLWAIGRLQVELAGTIAKPGGGKVVVN